MKFEVGEKVFIKVTPMNGFSDLPKKEVQTSIFIDTFKTLNKIGNMAYRLMLSPDLIAVHNIYHIGMLTKQIYQSFNWNDKSLQKSNKNFKNNDLNFV